MAIMEDFIVKYGDKIDAVFCHWDNGATGVINALENANMDGVYIVAVDGAPQVTIMLRTAPRLYASASPSPTW